ncbi:MAG: hypothetical protein Ct9H300mP1_30850 [Planctomycetaceae bacterium]|nr:MAG: hypothetical protein Ct9H300mP1_30850 [Planctomycetaceae bacterium]
MASDEYSGCFCSGSSVRLAVGPGAVWLQNGTRQMQLLADHQLDVPVFTTIPTRALNQRLLQDVSERPGLTHSPMTTANSNCRPTTDHPGACNASRSVWGGRDLPRKETPGPGRPGFLQFVNRCAASLPASRTQTQADDGGVERSKFSESFEHFVLECIAA